MDKIKTNLTNVKKNLIKRGRPAYPFNWPFPYEYTRAAMTLAGLTYKDILDIIERDAGMRISRMQLFNYFHGKHSIPPKIFRVLRDVFKEYLNFNLAEVGDAK